MKSKENPRRTSGTFSGARFIMGLIFVAVFFPGEAMVEVKGNSGGSQVKGPLTRFDSQQLKKLKAGEPVCKYSESNATAGNGECSIIVNAPIDRCFEILSKIDLQVHYVPNKTKSKIVSRNENKLLVEVEYQQFGYTIRYHSKWTIDEKNYRIEWEIDKSRPHDIEEISGFYQLEKIDEKTTLLTYGATKLDVGFSVPQFIKKFLLGRSIPAMAINIKKFIESNGKWRQED